MNDGLLYVCMSTHFAVDKNSILVETACYFDIAENAYDMALKTAEAHIGVNAVTKVVEFRFPTYGLNWTDEALAELVNNSLPALRSEKNFLLKIATTAS